MKQRRDKKTYPDTFLRVAVTVGGNVALPKNWSRYLNLIQLGHLHRFGQGTETEIEATLSSASESEAYGCTLKFPFSETRKTEVKLIQKPILR